MVFVPYIAGSLAAPASLENRQSGPKETRAAGRPVLQNLSTERREKMDQLKLTVKHILVLRGLHDHLSIREIADKIHNAHGWVQQLLERLEKAGYVRNTGKKIARGTWVNTQKGLEVLEKEGLLKERRS
jgi:predicted methyltransferase